MHSPEPSAPARPAFNWIDNIAIPVASCIMETQPIACFLLFWSLFLTSPEGNGFYFSIAANSPQIEPWALNSDTITLLLLWLHWWTMVTRERLPERWNLLQKRILQLLGPCLAIAIMAFVVDLSDLIAVGIFILAFWWLSIFLTEREHRDERLILSFRVGMIVLIAVLVFTYLMQLPTTMQTTLASSLPIFFFSGLIALSFTRLSIINQENARLPGASQSNATRNWFFILTALWGFIVVFSLLLETYAFSFFQTIMQLVFYLVGLIAYAILYLFFLLASFLAYLFGTPRAISLPVPQQPPPPPSHQQIGNISNFALFFAILRWLLIAIALILLILIVIAILRSIVIKRHHDVEEEEIRENLSLREVLAVRQPQIQEQEQQNLLEELDPESARARYRELLEAIATNNTRLARRKHETPLEYERRLNRLIRGESASQLHELTKAYQQERYAGTPLQRASMSDFRMWLAYFISQLRH